MKKSFGLEVAKIAGIPRKTIEEAKTMLHKLENEHQIAFGGQMQLGTTIREKVIYKEKESKLEQELSRLDINTLTPIQALQKLDELKRGVKK